MNNIDKKFTNKLNNSSDLISTIETKTPIESKDMHHDFTTINIPPEFRINASPFVNRAFYLGSLLYDTTLPASSLIKNGFYRLPGDAIRSNKALLNGMKIASYYRSKMYLAVSMAGTITHAGTVLVGIIPPLPQDIDFNLTQNYLINTILSGPHAFLHANNASSVKLEVPWYCNSDLATLDMEISPTYKPSIDITTTNGNYATFVAFVLNPLQPSAGSSNFLNITVEAIFENLDILVPCPRYITYTSQGLFSEIKTSVKNTAGNFATQLIGDGIDYITNFLGFTGLHNPNNATIPDINIINTVNRVNLVDSTQHFEKLDPYSTFDRILQEPIFNSTIDEMDIKHIISKRQYLGTFKVNKDDVIGTRLWTRPISPYQGGTRGQFGNLEPGRIANNIEFMHLLSRAWKGTIKITIQSVMNNKQQVKIRSLSLYGPSIQVASGYPVYTDILQAPSHLFEFTEGGQERTFDLPCLARNNIIYNMRENSSEGLFHGVYYMYLAQALANSSGSPETIYFNVFYELSSDFSFFGYSTEKLFSFGPFVLPASNNRIKASEITEKKEEQFTAQSGEEFIPIKPMNEDSAPNDMNTTLENTKPEAKEIFRLKPLTNVRDLVRRLYPNRPSEWISVGEDYKENIPIFISDLIGETVFFDEYKNNIPSLVSKMFYGKTGGVKCKLKFFCSTDLFELNIYYLPPQTYVNKDLATLDFCGPNYNAIDLQGFQIPVTFTNTARDAINGYVYEFVVPNVNMYKFVGAPTKMSNNQADYYSTLDLGVIVISVNIKKEARFKIRTETGFTDETRLGFHSIAPIIDTPVRGDQFVESPYVGNFTLGLSFASAIPNKFIYYTRT